MLLLRLSIVCSSIIPGTCMPYDYKSYHANMVICKFNFNLLDFITFNMFWFSLGMELKVASVWAYIVQFAQQWRVYRKHLVGCWGLLIPTLLATGGERKATWGEPHSFQIQSTFTRKCLDRKASAELPTSSDAREEREIFSPFKLFRSVFSDG